MHRFCHSLEKPVALSDDFVLPCGMKFKAKMHKLNRIYIQIKDLPQESRSKLKTIYSVASCNAAHFNGNFIDIDYIWNIIIRDPRILETKGIWVDEKLIRESRFHTVFDHLGANELYGFVKSFNTNYMCRHCSCTKEQHREINRDDPSLMRTKIQYGQCLESEDANRNDSMASIGVKRPCPLNNLKNFHIITNRSVDLMQESSRPNLGQNSTQPYCLFVHIPFILAEQRSKLQTIWQCFSTLHKAMTTMYSMKIRESDVADLDIRIENYLKNIQKFV